jgi:outer membrane protein OmpA-like peptidoglycan-associated protein
MLRRWTGISVVCLASTTALVGASGCVATRDWVREQLQPMSGRLDAVDRRVGEVDAKADRALAGLENLHFEDKMVLGMKEGANFGFDSAALSKQAEGEIDRFLKELKERGAADGAAERVFVVAGHTDSKGKADYNYQLGQRRAERVAGYLVSEQGINPMLVHVVSYGDSKPIASNKTPEGRRENRRIEILVYQHAVTASGGTH